MRAGPGPTAPDGLLDFRGAPPKNRAAEGFERDETVAPTAGVIQELGLRLDLTVLADHRTTSIEVAVKAIQRDAIPMMLRESERRVPRRGSRGTGSPGLSGGAARGRATRAPRAGGRSRAECGA